MIRDPLYDQVKFVVQFLKCAFLAGFSLLFKAKCKMSFVHVRPCLQIGPFFLIFMFFFPPDPFHVMYLTCLIVKNDPIYMISCSQMIPFLSEDCPPPPENRMDDLRPILHQIWKIGLVLVYDMILKKETLESHGYIKS